MEPTGPQGIQGVPGPTGPTGPSYYNPTAYIKDYVKTQKDKFVEKYEDL